MGIELPDELTGVAAATGAAWPQADEDNLREQARAWRDTQSRLTNIAGDADHAATGGVGALSGTAAEAAGTLWSGYVDPDQGVLTGAVRGAAAAADRLDHAADQVAAAKVEIVRHLVNAAKNTDAAQAAASAGHPSALLGVDTVLRGTATNLSALTHGLAAAVGPGGGPVDVSPLVDPNPGVRTHEGQTGLLGAVTGLPGHVLSASDALMTPLADTVRPGADLTGHALAPVADVALGAANDVTGHALGAVDGPAGVVRSTVGHALPAVDHAGDGAAGFLGSTMDTPRRLPRPAALGAAPDAGTGPLHLPHAGSGPYGGFLDSRGFDEVATPPSGLRAPVPGVTVASGFADAGYAPPPDVRNPGFGPGIAPPPPPPPTGPAPGPMAPPPFGGPPSAGPVAPPMAGPGAPAGGMTGVPAPGRRSPSVPPLRPFVAAPPQPWPYAAPPSSPVPPRPVAPMGAPRQERESVVALFLVHMFPIGHLPVPSDRPAMQLPVPPADVDYAPGLRFPPHDHPRSDLIESVGALEKVQAGLRRLASPPASPPAAVLEGHEPLGGLPERDWDRRFLVGLREGIAEYAWPPVELYPEGGLDEGEPQVLVEGTLLDRFGAIRGRVFAPEGTPFAHRSLPPSARDTGYRRYRVLRDVPMWQALSAGWFGQPGGGVRYRAVYSADELVTLGYLADVTFEERA